MPRKLTLKQVDEDLEDIWYETYDGNGTKFGDRFEFVENAITALKGMTKYSKILETVDIDKAAKMSPSKGDKYMADKSNFTYDIGRYASTKGIMNPYTPRKSGQDTQTSRKSVVHQAQLNAYESIYHTVLMELAPNDDTTTIKMELQKLLTEELFLKKRSPHFLASMGYTKIREYKSVMADISQSVPNDVGMAMVYERYTDNLEWYMDEDDDFKVDFFYYNVFFQAIIALAQFHKRTGMHLNGLTYDNLFFLYSQDFNALEEDDIEQYYWNEYETKDGSFYTPALNLVVILHNFEKAQTIDIDDGAKALKQYLDDYESIVKLFINKRKSKVLKQFMDKMRVTLTREWANGNIKYVINTPDYIIKTFAKLSGTDKVNGAVFSSKSNYDSNVMNEIKYIV